MIIVHNADILPLEFVHMARHARERGDGMVQWVTSYETCIAPEYIDPVVNDLAGSDFDLSLVFAYENVGLVAYKPFDLSRLKPVLHPCAILDGTNVLGFYSAWPQHQGYIKALADRKKYPPLDVVLKNLWLTELTN